MSKKPKEFQLKTAKHIAHLFKTGQNRVLLSDEVGLGKTIVARKVIELLASKQKSNLFKVVYICSNAGIANQNAQTIGYHQNSLDVSESRLSMQHLYLYHEKKKGVNKSGKNGTNIQLIPLTPSTSFYLNAKKCGNKHERALIYVLLRHHFKGLNQKKFSTFMQKDVTKENWDKIVTKYNSITKEKGNSYTTYIKKALKEKQAEKIYNGIKNIIKKRIKDDNKTKAYKLVNDLRQIFAQISLERMLPDLVIMDEFQRFRPLIECENYDKDSETHMLIKKFFGNKETKILLLSATPFKPYTTLEELSESNIKESYNDFFSVINFLLSDKVRQEKFEKKWTTYSKNLLQLNNHNFKILKESKDAVEKELYKIMCRTERVNTEILDSSNVKEIPIASGDILSYYQMQKLLNECHIRDCKSTSNSFAHSYKIPMDYIKSAPFLLSFMDGYVLKEHVFKNSFKEEEKTAQLLSFIKSNPKCMLNHKNVEEYNEIGNNNARLEYLKKILFNDTNSEQLLWVPASNPYYKKVGGVFEKNMDFSKIFIFSSWSMVPKMLSTLLSYEAERRTKNDDSKYHTPKKQKYGFQSSDGQKIVEFVSPKIAKLYDPAECYGKSLKSVYSIVSKRIKDKLKSIAKDHKLGKNGQNTAINIHRLLLLIEGNKNEPLKSIPSCAVDILTNIAIASPGSCFFRLFVNTGADEKHAKEFAAKCTKEFVSLFNHRENAAVIYKTKKDYKISYYNNPKYYEYVLNYCVRGNLQSVLDEYAFMIGKKDKDLVEELITGFIPNARHLQVNTYRSKEFFPLNMRIHYALSYTNTKQEDEVEKSNINIQKVFNSPFRPFVLASTSIGQEGLDFHKYARKIMHWNLPSNPVELEQREGRVNRYLNLSIRRNVAHMYAKKYGKLRDWGTMFNQIKQEDGGMIPYWYLSSKMLQNMKNKHIPVEKIERIFAMYPLSSDVSKYEHVKKVLTLYRLTMGQPNQEELLNELDGKLNEKQIKELLIQLSPFIKK